MAFSTCRDSCKPSGDPLHSAAAERGASTEAKINGGLMFREAVNLNASRSHVGLDGCRTSDALTCVTRRWQDGQQDGRGKLIVVGMALRRYLRAHQ